MGLHFTVEVIKHKNLLGVSISGIKGLPEKWNEDLSREITLLQYVMAGAIKANVEMQEMLERQDATEIRAKCIEANAYVDAQYELAISRKEFNEKLKSGKPSNNTKREETEK
jgi:hypothetical protein